MNSYASRLSQSLAMVPLGNVRKRLHRIGRRIRTSNFRGRLALGETLDYVFPRGWVFVDRGRADFPVDLARDPALPFRNSTFHTIYSAHLIEHLPNASLERLLLECFRVLRRGGYIRVEAPDHELLRDLYVAQDASMLNHFRQFRKNVLVEQFGYPVRYLEEHLSLLGEISNYIVEGEGCHVPVYATRAEFEERLASSDLDGLSEWAVSLQSCDQLASGGHQNVIYFQKVRRMLAHCGFEEITRRSFGETGIPGLCLNGGSGSIREKEHRRFYSLYVEARRP